MAAIVGPQAENDMVKTLRALVLREAPYKESSRILTVLTDTEGKLTVSARGAKRRGSKTAAASQLLAYSEMTLSCSSGRWYLNEASTIELFEGLRGDISALALGTYFAELLDTVSREDMPDPEMLRLGLNSLYLLSENKYTRQAIKPSFELKLMALSGYEPTLDGCCVCGEENPPSPLFDTEGGVVCCGNCRGSLAGKKLPLCAESLEAMRRILTAEGARAFSFKLSPEAFRRLGAVCEEYVAFQLERHFKSLDYYYKLEL